MIVNPPHAHPFTFMLPLAIQAPATGNSDSPPASTLLTRHVTQLPRIKRIANNTHLSGNDKRHRRGQLTLFGKMALQFGLSDQQRGYVRVFGVQRSGNPFIIGHHGINPSLPPEIFNGMGQAEQVRLLRNRLRAGMVEVFQPV